MKREDWSWKPGPDETPNRMRIESAKSRGTMNKRDAKKLACKFIGRKVSCWMLLATKLSEKTGEHKSFSSKPPAVRYIHSWANGTPFKATTKVGSATFYASWEWKKARFEVLKKYGAECMLCGSDDHVVVDHIKPRSKFPELELDLDNLQVLCNDCNMGKSNDDYTDFRPE